jgi:hypothetical protein
MSPEVDQIINVYYYDIAIVIDEDAWISLDRVITA